MSAVRSTMFIELIDTLRCPRPHEDSWLVGAFDEIIERDVRAGRLGCPICRAEYAIVDGVVQFEDGPATGNSPRRPEHDTAAMSAEAVLRLAAMLDLASPGGLVVLHGEWGRAAPPLARVVEAQLLLLDPPDGFAERERLSAVMCRSTVPVAPGSCRGIALHDRDAASALGAGAERALRSLGRLIIPAGASLPDGFRLLARDASWTVAERDAPPPGMVKLETPRRR